MATFISGSHLKRYHEPLMDDMLRCMHKARHVRQLCRNLKRPLKLSQILELSGKSPLLNLALPYETKIEHTCVSSYGSLPLRTLKTELEGVKVLLEASRRENLALTQDLLVVQQANPRVTRPVDQVQPELWMELLAMEKDTPMPSAWPSIYHMLVPTLVHPGMRRILKN